MIAVVAAAALAAGRERWVEAVALVGALAAPWPTTAAVMALAALGRWRDGGQGGTEIRFHHHIAGELRGGASLRLAIAAAVDAQPELGLAGVAGRLAAGHPIDHLAGMVAARLPDTGRLAEAAVVFSAESGGRAAEAFEVMAEIAAEQIETRREVAAALAPAWMAVGLIGGGPVVVLAGLIATGRLASTFSAAGGRWAAVMGGVLIASGAATVTVMARRALR